MTNLQTLLIVLGIIAAALLVLAFVVPMLKKGGIDLDKVLAQTQSAINTASTAFAIIMQVTIKVCKTAIILSTSL